MVLISIFFLLGVGKFGCSILKSESNKISVHYRLSSPKPLHACSVELPEETHHSGLLAGSGRPVNQQVGEVSTLDQELQMLGLFDMIVQLRELFGTMFVNPQRHDWSAGLFNSGIELESVKLK